MKKYELMCDVTKTALETTVYRIKYLVDIPEHSIKTGDIGGWIESESNLNHSGNAVVRDNAVVRGNAVVCGDVIVCGDAVVRGNAVVCGNAVVRDNAVVCGDAFVCGDAVVRDRPVQNCHHVSHESNEN